MYNELKVGPQVAADGTVITARGLKDGGTGIQDVHARYQESAYRGGLFILDSGAVTLAAANTTAGALGTIKLINGFYNPINSGKNAVLVRAVAATVSGTPAGPLFYNYYAGLLVTSAATGTIRSALLSTVAPASSAMTAQVNVVVVTTPAATPAAIQLGTMGGAAAIAAGTGIYSILDELAGSIIVPPGCVFGLAAVGAGTTHIVQSSLWWEEVAV